MLKRWLHSPLQWGADATKDTVTWSGNSATNLGLPISQWGVYQKVCAIKRSIWYLRDRSLSIYSHGSVHALSAG